MSLKWFNGALNQALGRKNLAADNDMILRMCD